MIDTHCHINDSKYTLKENEIVKLCTENGITKLICSGADEESSKGSVELSNKFDCVYATVGVHPDYASTYNDNLEKEFQDLLNNNKKIVAVGEIGLDYHERQDNKEEQKQCFIKQIDLANRNNFLLLFTQEKQL
jgi:TatD DNase family protein